MAARALLLLLLLAGCAARDGAFPTLAPRPVEQADIGAEPAEPEAAAPARDPAATTRTAAALAAAEAGGRTFAAALAEAEPRVRAAAGASAGSDRWVEAQLALSRLHSATLPTADALQALDDERAAIGEGPADPSLEAARARAAALAADQAARLSRLEALLPQ